MGGAKCFSNFDLVAEYWQVKIRQEDIHKTAFVMPWGQYEYLRMPFGLYNVLVTFQRLMNFVLQEHLGEFVIVYLDDIFVYSQTYEEHVQHIEWVLTKLEEANLKLKLEKCKFAKREIKVLRHRVDAEGTRPNPGKVEAILKQPRS